MSYSHKSHTRGFTLLELIIVIAILAILSVAVIVVINPAETLRRARDSQRLSDLSAIKSALGLYLADVTSPDLDAGVANHCLGGTNTAALISYSLNNADVACTANVAEGADVTSGSTFGGTGAGGDFCRYASASGAVDGTGWIPVNLTAISSGSPLSNFPTDPTNQLVGGNAATAPDANDLMYRYACQQGTVAAGKPSPAFEVVAVLESTYYATTLDVDGTDGGDDAGDYEVGTSLRLIGNDDVH
jgi:prepilin-type N-terminal cleavage/methylation domain-containing protein